jgi:putative chitinase
MLITAPQLHTIMPTLKPAARLFWLPALDAAAGRFGITTPDRLAAWLAQLAVESQELRRGRENLNYTTLTRLRAVYQRLRPESDTRLRKLLRNPEGLGAFVYANMLGNGSVASKDGWNYRGGGPIGLTGRAQYRACGLAIGQPLEAQPHLIEEPSVGALSAAWFWQTRGLNTVVDELEGDAETRRVTLLINGGFNSLADRIHYAEIAERAFGLS